MQKLKLNKMYAAKLFVYLIIFVLLFCLIDFMFSLRNNACTVKLSVESINMGAYPLEIFYTTQDELSYKQENTVGLNSENASEYSFNGSIALPIKNASGIRVDLGNGAGTIKLREMIYSDSGGYCRITPAMLAEAPMHDLKLLEASENELILEAFSSDGINPPDPYIEINSITTVSYDNSISIIDFISAAIALAITLITWKFIRLKSIYTLFADLVKSRRLIFSLATNDFKTKYAGSYFGIMWAFVQPICTILVFWFVFQIGFRNTDIGSVPYICWFSCGLIPWFFFSEAWNGATNSLIEYSFLVKKVVFKVNILPLVKIISAFFVHVFFVLFMITVFSLYRIKPNLYWLQVFYYCFCMIMLIIALSFITVSLVVFFRDLGQIMAIILQFGMWLTPIMWTIDTIDAISSKFTWLFKLNPMFYITQGYRDSFIYSVPFYSKPMQTLYFWILVILLMLAGALLFKRLKPHFADVL